MSDTIKNVRLKDKDGNILHPEITVEYSSSANSNKPLANKTITALLSGKVNAISQADYNTLQNNNGVDSTVPYLVITDETLGAEKKALLYYNNQLYNFANPSTENNEIQQKVSLNATKNNNIEIATADSNNKLMIKL